MSQAGAPAAMAAARPAMLTPITSRPMKSTLPARALSVMAPRYGAMKMDGTSCTMTMRLAAAAPPVV